MALDLVKTERLVRRIAEHLRDRTPASSLFGLAEDFASRCAAVNQRLAQCVEMMASGRHIDAMQHATTTPDVLEMAAALSDPEIEGWRDFCTKEGLTVPENIDEVSKQKIDPLYAKVDAYLQKLLGDYRAAQMRRDSEASLITLRKIVKANAGDVESKASLKQLEESMVREELTKLKLHLAASNDPAILQSLSRLEHLSPDREPAGDVWMQALERKSELEAADAMSEVERLLQQSRQQVIDGNSDAVHHAVATIQTLVAEHALNLSSDSSAKLEDLVEWVAAARRKARDDAEHAAVLAQLRDQMRIADDHVFRMREMGTPVLQEDHAGLRKTWKRLIELGRPVSEDIQNELARLSGRLKHEIDRRSGTKTRNLVLVAAAVVVTSSLACWQAYRYWHASSLVEDLVLLEQQREVDALQALVSSIEQEKASLAASFSRLASQKVSAQAWLDAHTASVSQIDASLKALELLAQSGFKEAEVGDCIEKIAQAGKRIAELPAASQQEPTGRLDRVDLAWRQHLLGIKDQYAARLRAELDALEQEASSTLVFTRSAAEILTAAGALRKRLTAMETRLKPVVKELEPSLAEVTRFNQLGERVRQFAEAAEKFEARTQASRMAADFTAWKRSVRDFSGSPFLQGESSRLWNQIMDVNTGFLSQDDILRSFLLPDDKELWDEFVGFNKGKSGTGHPPDISDGESRLFLALRDDNNLKGIYRHPLQQKTVYTQGALITNEARLGEQTSISASGVIYQPALSETELRFEDKRGAAAFKETRTAAGTSGLMPKNSSLTKESEFLAGLLLENATNSTVTQFSRSLLPLVDRLVAAPDLNPLFRAYLHRRLGEIMSYRPETWGLRWTSFSKDLEALKQAGAGQLASGDWMVPVKNRQFAKPLEEYYKNLGHTRYYSLARVLPLVFERLYAGGIVYAGCVMPDGSLHVEKPGDSPVVWGFAAGRKATVFPLDQITKVKGHPYTPLYRTLQEPRRMVQSACKNLQLDPEDPELVSMLPAILR